MPELSPEAKAEMQAAIAILKSDGFHIHKTYPAFAKAQAEADAAAKDADTGEGKPPPVKDKTEPEYDEHVGLWGTRKVPRKKPDDAPPA